MSEDERMPSDLKEEKGPFDIIGDIHGCFRELIQLLEKLGYRLEKEEGESRFTITPPLGRKVIFLGDLVDRGPQTPEVLQLVMDMVDAGLAYCVPGNHDMKLLKKLKGGKVKATHGLQKSLEQLAHKDVAFIERVIQFLDHLTSHYVLDGGHLVVAHAGLKEEFQGQDSGKGRAFALYGTTEGKVDEQGFPIREPWAQEYQGQALVVYGHTPVAEPHWINQTINIDTGCVFGGKLTALRYPELELISVDAAWRYAQPSRPFIKRQKQGIDLYIKKGLTPLLMGPFRFPPSYSQHLLSFHAQQLLEQAFSNIDSTKRLDYHVHLIGTRQTTTGNFIHPSFSSWKHPLRHLTFLAFQIGFGIENIAHADEEALEGLTHLIDQMPTSGKYCLLAFESYYDERGNRDVSKSQIHLANEYIYQVALQRQDIFIPSMSIHPYRVDAIEELEKWAERGVKIIKWLPNSMGINPMDRLCLPFYKKMQELNLILLTHVGDEVAIPDSDDQELGNPLLFRKALDENVKIIMAHCATLGKNKDIEQSGKWRSNFEFFLRLMEDPQYKNHLVGDISAVTQINRMQYLPYLIDLSQPGSPLANRLVNGSDYPLPVFYPLISTKLLRIKGLITKEEQRSLNEIYAWNPLLFDFVLKRTLRHSQSQKQFPTNIFMANENFNILG